ncbi:MAG: helix-turn-helix domain-containing protein [Actinomycetota bacterium]
MSRYGQYCPVAKAAEVLAERWTPLVVRELMCGSSTFNDLKRGVPLMSRTLLSKRLRELERAGVVERRPTTGRSSHGYHLTPAGEELRPIVMGLGEWGQRWVRAEVTREDLDPTLVMWDMRRGVAMDRVPDRRTVVHFVFTDVPKTAPRRTWLVIDRPEVDVCYKDPGYEVDLIVTTPLRRLIEVWMGDFSFGESMRDGSIVIDGPRQLAAKFPTWLRLSPFAQVERSVVSRLASGD